MLDVIALGEVLIDFASRGIDANSYPLMQALPGGIPSIPEKAAVLQAM